MIFKNWVLSRCIAKAYSADATKRDAEISASAYLEYGFSSIEMYEKGEMLVDEYLARNYSGSIDGKYNTMKCIDLFHSQALDALSRHQPSS